MVGSKPGLEKIWPAESVRRLHAAWIDTPFQLVAIAEGPDGLKAIAEMTGKSPEEVSRLIDQSRRLLTDDEKAQLSRRLTENEMPLGAQKPKP